MRTLLVILSLLLLMFSANTIAGTVTPRLQQAIDAADTPSDTFPVIIRFQTQLDANAFTSSNALLSQSALKTKFIKALKTLSDTSVNLVKSLLPKNQQSKQLWLINAVAIDLPANLITPIAALPLIKTIDLDIEISLFGAITGTPAAPTWNLDLINIADIWSYGYTGEGVVIASMDTGVDINHPDLQSKYRGGTNSWFDPYGQHATPADVFGHGTQTMGIMVGGDASGSSIGVAPGAQWISAKIFNDSGIALTSAIHEGFQWMLDPDGNPATDDAPDVVNNSWGITSLVGGCDTEYTDDVQMLNAVDIAVVFAAGNSGPGASTSLSPANYIESFAVGAVDDLSNVAFFSSRGPSACEDQLFPDLVAPGVNVRTTDLTFGGVIPNSYADVSGTSFAAPHVAATMALLKSAMPTVTIDELKSAMRNTAGDLFPVGPDTDSGYGLLNAKAAYYQLPIDTDGDGVFDGADNCILMANTDQIDSNGDGYGNACDGDYNNDQIVDITDFLQFRDAFGTMNADVDLTGDNLVDIADFLVFRDMFSLPPGPSALVP